jgi:hypothetical protein
MTDFSLSVYENNENENDIDSLNPNISDSNENSDSENLIEKHKKELAQLAVNDPQFYEFLKKEEGGEELLRFGQDDVCLFSYSSLSN